MGDDMDWASVIAIVALGFSIACFVLFFLEARRTAPKPEEVVREVVAQAQAEAQAQGDAQLEPARTLDPNLLAAVAKGLAEALGQVGPGLLALIGSFLFLLLAGEAAGVYSLTGEAETNQADPGANNQNAADGNGVEGNEAGENETGGDEAEGNEAGGE